MDYRFAVKYTSGFSVENSSIFFIAGGWAYPMVNGCVIVEMLIIAREIYAMETNMGASSQQVHVYIVSYQGAAEVESAVVERCAGFDSDSGPSNLLVVTRSLL